MSTEPVSGTTLIYSAASAAAGGPSFLFGVVTGEWGAIATGVSIGVIGGMFAVVSFLRDKQIALLRKQIDGLAIDVQDQRDGRKAAEHSSDTWERKAHQVEERLAELEHWKANAGCLNAPECPRRATP